MKCLLCGQENDQGAERCNACGTELVPEEKILHPPVTDALVIGGRSLERTIPGKDGTPMVLVPPGEGILGADDGYENEKPSHRQVIDAFYIDVHPVTNDQFEAFARSSGYRAQGDWRSLYRTGREAHPVAKVTWHDALAYCQWAEKILPTEEQWERSARGEDGRKFPWGDEWDSDRLNSFDHGPGTTSPVGNYPRGASPCGCLDMAGNVWEWTVSLYNAYAGSNFTSICFGSKFRIMKGGSFRSRDPKGLRCSVRMPADPFSASDMRGFRGMSFPR